MKITSSQVGGALSGLSSSMLLASLGTSIANVGLPTLAQTFGVPFQSVQWVVLAYLLAMTALLVSAGRLGDVLGRKRLLLAGIVIFMLGSALCGMSAGLAELIAARAVQGLGAAVMMALTLAFVGDTVPKARIGSAMGLLGTMSAIGTALGPSLGGLLIAVAGWPALFWVNVPLAALTGLLAWRYLPADQQQTQRRLARLDGLGTLLRDRSLRAGLVMSGVVTLVMMTTLVVGPFYLSRALGLTTARVGLVMSCGPCISALTGVVAGRLVDRFGAGRIVAYGLGAMTLGCCLLALSSVSLGVLGYLLPIAVTTVGYATFQAANNTAVMANVRSEQRGVVSGMLNLARNLGLIAGAAAMGSVFSLSAGAHDVATALPQAVAHGMRVTFAVATALIVALLWTAPARTDRWSLS